MKYKLFFLPFNVILLVIRKVGFAELYIYKEIKAKKKDHN